LDLLFGKGRPHRRNRLVDPGGRERDRIHLSLDHDDAAAFTGGRRRTVQVEQCPPFVENGVSGEFKYLGASFRPVSRIRAAKPITLPRASWIGIVSRSRKRSYGSRSSTSISKPASTSIGSPYRPSASFSALRLFGA